MSGLYDRLSDESEQTYAELVLKIGQETGRCVTEIMDSYGAILERTPHISSLDGIYVALTKKAFDSVQGADAPIDQGRLQFSDWLRENNLIVGTVDVEGMLQFYTLSVKGEEPVAENAGPLYTGATDEICVSDLDPHEQLRLENLFYATYRDNTFTGPFGLNNSHYEQ